MLLVLMNVLVYAMTAPVSRGPYDGLDGWLRAAAKCPFTGTVERALWSGFHADRLGYAFAGGYGAALVRLFDHAARAQQLPSGRPFPDPPLRGLVALAATETGGAHPRSIATRLDKQGGALVLRGEKTFATLATAADELLVVATRGVGADGKNRLRVVRVKKGHPGVRIEPRPEVPFAPEIPHAIVKLADCIVDDRDVLPGDGYLYWLKPFRTIEDIHVLASTVGYLLGAARANGWSRATILELTSVALALVDLGARDASSPLTHLLVAGLFGNTRRLVDDLDAEWARSSEEERMRWERDRPLLGVAETARGKRTEAAWAAIESQAGERPTPISSS